MRLEDGPSVMVIGSINVDWVASVERLPRRGETVQGLDFQQHMGGKGANQAVATALMGARVEMLGCVGNDAAGAEALQELDRAGVDRRRVRIVDDGFTGTALITVGRRGENTIVVIPGANGLVSVEQVEATEAALVNVTAVILQFEVPDDVVLAAARVVEKVRRVGTTHKDGAAREADGATEGRIGPLLVVNPSPFRESALPPLDQVDILVVNEVEAEEMTGRPVTDPASAVDAAATLLPSLRTGGAVVVTLGSHGAVALGDPGRRGEQDGPWYVPALKVKAVDTTGAGDVFTGALVAALASGQTMPDALHLANAAGGLCVMRAGAQSSFPTREEMARLVREAPYPQNLSREG